MFQSGVFVHNSICYFICRISSNISRTENKRQKVLLTAADKAVVVIVVQSTSVVLCTTELKSKLVSNKITRPK